MPAWHRDAQRDRRERRLARQHGHGVPRRQHAHRGARLDRRRAQVREQDDVLELEQRPGRSPARARTRRARRRRSSRRAAPRRAPPRRPPGRGRCSPGTPSASSARSRRASIRWRVRRSAGSASRRRRRAPSSSSSVRKRGLELGLERRRRPGAGPCRRSRIPNARARRAVAVPIWPRPTIPSVLPCMPAAQHEVHAPRPGAARAGPCARPRRAAGSPSGSGRRRGRRSRRSSTPGVFVHTTPRAVQAATSTLS